MTTPSLPHDHGADKLDETGGTSEETSLTVKLLGEDWIVENGVGKSIGSAEDREAAIELATQAAGSEKASSIAVLAADGTVEKTVRV